MTNERSGSGQDKHTDTDILKRSFERETDGQQHEANRDAAGEKHRRSVLGAPVDPNSPTTKGGFPPGVPPEDVVEPGRATPGSGTVDNRSGEDSADRGGHRKP